MLNLFQHRENACFIRNERENKILIAHNALGTETKIITAFPYNNMVCYFKVKIAGGMNNGVRKRNIFLRGARIARRMIVY